MQATKRIQMAVFLTVFVDLLGFGILIPILPLYAQSLAAHPSAWMSRVNGFLNLQSPGAFWVGVAFVSFSLMQFLAAPVLGRLSDLVGRRPVLWVSLMGSAVGYTMLAVTHRFEWVLAARILDGITGGNISVAQAAMADSSSPKERSKVLGMIGAAFGLGFTFGPLIGGILSKYAHVEGQLPPVPGYAAAGLSLAAALFGYWKLPEPARHKGGSRAFGVTQLREAFGNGRVGLLLLLNFCNITAFSAFETMFIYFGIAKFPSAFHQPTVAGTPTMDDVLRAAPVAGYYLFGVGVISAIIQGGLIRRLVPRFGETRLAIAGPAILALALGIVGGAPTWSIVIFGCILMPCGFGLSNPSVNSLLSRAVPPERQGAFLGLNQSGGSLARLLAPAIAGLLFTSFGPESPFFAASATLLLSTLIAWTYHRRYGSTFPRDGSEAVVAEG